MADEKSTPTYQFHPIAGIFPLMSAREFDELVADIRANGQRQPIVLHRDGTILDGRNRYSACVAAGVTPRFVTWSGQDGDEVAYVVSLNLHRRHLDESQRAVVAARIATLDRGKPNASIDAFRQTDAAEILNVSRGSVQRAREVLFKGDPALIAAVESGAVAVSTAADLTDLTREEQREIVARGEAEILKAAKQIRAGRLEERRAERMTTLAEVARGNTPLVTDTKYPIVYADPPWRYEHVETESRAIENQYPTMALEDICAMPLVNVTTDDAVLFMWATSPKLAEAMRVIESWGFTYRTCMVWVKDQIGMGYYARQQHELLLIAAKGAPPMPAPADRPASVVNSPRTAHSAKPEVFYELIERMYPALPRIELFARRERKGWDQWGNQAA